MSLHRRSNRSITTNTTNTKKSKLFNTFGFRQYSWNMAGLLMQSSPTSASSRPSSAISICECNTEIRYLCTLLNSTQLSHDLTTVVRDVMRFFLKSYTSFYIPIRRLSKKRGTCTPGRGIPTKPALRSPFKGLDRAITNCKHGTS